jgi:hypothetical protein
MKTKTINIIIALLLSIMLFAANGFADIPAPPVNQLLAMPDTPMNLLVEAECRACHENNSINPTTIPDRHHLLYGQEIVKGQCRNGFNECLSDADCTGLDTCTGKTAATDPYAGGGLYNCLACHEEEGDLVSGTTNFLVVRDCLVCHIQVPGEASVHHLTATAQGVDSPLGDPERGDCTPCHGTFVDDYGDSDNRYCYEEPYTTSCKSDSDCPTDVPCKTKYKYEPSFITPTVRAGSADEQNIEGSRAGSCTYCHSSGTGSNDPGTEGSGVEVYRNGTLHHTAGVHQDRHRNSVNGGCEFCHGNPVNYGGDALALRNCQECHGLESLHNIQADSNGDDEIVVNGEDYGYGHVGIDDPTKRRTCTDDGLVCTTDADCTLPSDDSCQNYGGPMSWCLVSSAVCTSDADCPDIINAVCVDSRESDCYGCHGFGFTTSAAAPGSGPVTPYLNNSDKQVILTGTDTTISLSGSSLTNISGTTLFEALFTLTAQDGSRIVLTPEQINNSSATLIIPGDTPAGNYKLRAAKGSGITWTLSNPLSISIKEPLIIESQTMSASCGECSGEMTITGSGFGNEADPILLQVIGDNIIKLNIVSWTDTKITATEADCDGSEITINGFSATN